MSDKEKRIQIALDNLTKAIIEKKVLLWKATAQAAEVSSDADAQAHDIPVTDAP